MSENLNKTDELWVQCSAGAIQQVADSGVLSFDSAIAEDLSKTAELWEQCPAGAIQQVADSGVLSFDSAISEDLSKTTESWEQCPAGAIQQVADTTVLSRPSEAGVNPAKRKFMVTAATAAGVAVLGGGAFLATRPGVPKPSGLTVSYGGIDCVEVYASAKGYIAGEFDGSEKGERIEKHLAKCSKCRKFCESLS